MSTLPAAPSFGPDADLELNAGAPVSNGGANSAHPGLRAEGQSELTPKDGESENIPMTPREDTGERM